MRMFSDPPDSFNRVAGFGSSERELVFDDEPIGHLLYGENSNGPTSASVYALCVKHMGKISEAHAKGDTQTVIDLAASLVLDGYAISVGACFELAGIMVQIVPQVPNPIMMFDLSPLGPLLEKIWHIAIERQEISLQKRIGFSLYRWYEHHRKYQQARTIIADLIGIYSREGKTSAEAAARNNFAFEFFLEGRFLEAIPEFEESARFFRQTGEAEQCANALANSWMSRFEEGDLKSVVQAESQIERLARILDRSGMWQARKPLVMMAKIAEKRGEIQKAIGLVRRAIKACRDSGTLYPEMDEKYLAHLRAMKERSNE